MDKFIHFRIDSRILDRYRRNCADRGISVSDDLRGYIDSVLEEENEVDSSPAEEKNSGVEEIDPKTGFRRNVRFNDKGFILSPKTEAEIKYNRAAISG